MNGKTVAIIPARNGSVGLPGKNIRPLDGVPLVARSIIAAKAAEMVDEVYVSSDGEEILKIAKEFGAHPILRPDNLSTGSASSEAALMHALHTIQQEQGSYPSILVFLQCTSPLTTSREIDSVINTLVEHNVDSVFSANPDHSFIWERDEHGLAVGVTHDPSKPRQRRQDIVPRFRENGAIYAMKAATFLDQKSRFCGTTMLVPMSSPLFDIDTLEDWNFVEAYLKATSVNETEYE